ncbi:hypothetical protein [Flavobacterium dankookense]|uniref:Uncharacterized protein n=1 Tax=Flavobacterium dankookense TaxID=706186 RepID=A0A4R6Q6B9_9FLAO|nr:hypothetical protein [Flavobacterium dankookense]TDP57575.1 hypothetical protein BC748_2788 [Flavobacterium dankookense]
MKQFLVILVLLFSLNACDDGDLEVKNIDFEDVVATKCSGDKDVIYKIKDTEMLLIEIPADIFENDETPEGEPIEVNISSTVKVKYRQYNGAVSVDNICPAIPDATPSLLEEWNALAGTIEITSTAIKTTDATTGATKITGYKHYIVFKNITFEKPGGTQVYSSFVFGNYNTTATALSFGFDEEVAKSSCDNRLFNFNGSEVLTLDTDEYATLFVNEVTTEPRTALISSTNKLTYSLYGSVVNDAFFCTTPNPTIPAQLWIAEDGVDNVSGIIEVTTIQQLVGVFQHTIRLKKVTMKKGNSDFYLGDNYLFGTLLTN